MTKGSAEIPRHTSFKLTQGYVHYSEQGKTAGSDVSMLTQVISEFAAQHEVPSVPEDSKRLAHCVFQQSEIAYKPFDTVCLPCKMASTGEALMGWRTDKAYEDAECADYRAWRASLSWRKYAVWQWRRWRAFVAGAVTALTVVACIWLLT